MSNLDIKVKAKGMMRVELIDVATGETRFDSGIFGNTLLNSFFSSDTNNLTQCIASTDAVVAVTDTTAASLGTTTAVTVTALPIERVGSVVTTVTESKYTFTAGAVVGNLSCVALTAAGSLRVKTLIKDVNGDPTSISVKATDQLVVTHTLRLTVDQYPAAVVKSIDGVDYSFQFVASRFDPTRADNGTFSCVTFSPFALFPAAASSVSAGVSLAVSAVAPTLGAANTNIALTGYASLGANFATVTNTPTEGKSKAVLVGTIAANVQMAGGAGIGFIGAGQSNNNDRTYSGFIVTPPLPKDANTAYTFTITYTLSR